MSKEQKMLQYLDEGINPSVEYFLSNVRSSPSILEIGTRRWQESNPTHHMAWFLNRGINISSYIKTDFMDGLDVDIISDAHRLSETLGENRFDAVWSSSVWEHLHSPWVASLEVLRVLKPGGVFFIQTHFTFCEHGYPDDYFRFTRKALEICFEDASEVVSCYDFPAEIRSRYPSQVQIGYLNVCIAGKK